MPKKHTPTYQSTKPQPLSHVSLTSRSRADSENTDSRSLTVNGRLAQLRASQRSAAKTHSAQDSAFASVLSGPSQNQRTLIQDARRCGRIAGPPPPRSWIDPRVITPGLEASRYADKKAQRKVEVEFIDWNPPPIMPGQPLPVPHSLRAMSMRALARSFSEVVERNPWLVYDLTQRMKCELVAVMTLYHPSVVGTLSQGKLGYLFGPIQEEDGTWTSGGDGVTHLSLGTVLRAGIEYGHLAKNLRRTSPAEQEDIPDSWDEANATSVPTPDLSQDAIAEQGQGELHTADSMIYDIPKGIWKPLFPSVTHLSLAHPISPCWSSLLEVGLLEGLSHLTHLDLSHWPAPSLQFLSVETRMTTFQTEANRSSPGIDNQKEQIRLFNRLGKACRALTWLGLEGCEGWIPCLGATYDQPSVRLQSRYDIDGRARTDNLIRVDWTGVWRGLKSVKVVQSWVPLRFSGEEALIKDPVVYRYLSADSSDREWWEKERHIRQMARIVTDWRLEAGQSPVKFEKTTILPWLEVEIIKSDLEHVAASGS